MEGPVADPPRIFPTEVFGPPTIPPQEDRAGGPGLYLWAKIKVSSLAVKLVSYR